MTKPDVIKAAEWFVPVQINGDKAEGKRLMERYRVPGYPTIVFVDGRGNVVARNGGKMVPKGFVETLRLVSGRLAEAPTLRDANDPATAAKLATLATWSEDRPRAVETMRRANRLDGTNRTGLMGEAWNGMGDLYTYLGKYPNSMLNFAKAIQYGRGGERSYAALSMGWNYHLLDQQPPALAAFERVLAMNGIPNWHKDYARMLMRIVVNDKKYRK